ncbi:protein NRT1/ PTR FAMILY 8.3-like isoform X1 [Miscanthus floridulus]|uniref:protein NRT1/ PTR FAMILY 8.3-like isoform X1 n=1 Tax=Miscanthus floridulus TaxID=154761 RepID=UPI00345A0BFF
MPSCSASRPNGRHMAEGEEQWRRPCTSQCTGDSVAFLVSGGSEDMPSTGAPFSASSPPQVIANKADSVQAAAHSSAFTASRPEYELCTSNGSVDIKGNPASKKHTGKWRACYSILGGEFCGSLAYYGVGTNLVSYLTKVRKQSSVTAASNIASWQGTCYLTPLLGAFLADSYWGRHRTSVISLTIFTIGMVLLTLAAVIPASIHTLDIAPQDALPSLGLFLTALGLGGIWPCVPTFGADQFDDTDGTEKMQKGLYYNWYYLAVNGGFFFASTLLVYVQDSWGWGWGFGIPTLFSVIGIAGFLACMKLYRYQKPAGSALTRICQVVVAAVRKVHVDVPNDSSLLYELPGKEAAIVGSRKLMHTEGLRFFDRAATISSPDETSSADVPSPWKLCTVTQVEELKILARMLPVLLAGIIFNMAEAFFPLFIEQGEVMDNYIYGFSIPPASLTTFNCLCILILAPCYNKVIMPMLSMITGMKRGLSELQRIGVGLVFPMLSLVSAALVEMVRLRIVDQRGLVHRNAAAPMNILWQAPQYFFVGVAKVFTVVGFIEFAYEQSPDAMRSLCQACSLIMITLGSYLVSMMLKFVDSATVGRGRHGWIPDNLNEGHLDHLFWLMAGLQLLNLLTFA